MIICRNISICRFLSKTNQKYEINYKKQHGLTIIFVILFLQFNFLLYAQGGGTALQFDNMAANVNIPSSSGDELNPSDAVTAECWVFPFDTSSADHQPRLVVKHDSWVSRTHPTHGHLRFSVNDGGWREGVSGDKMENTNTWYHFAGVFDGSSVSIYVNGILEGFADFGSSTQLAPRDFDVKIGGMYEPRYTLNGYIDEVRVWNVARTGEDIREFMNKKLTNNDTTGIVGYWRLDETSGSTAYDRSQFNNDGTLENMGDTSWVISTAPLGDASIFAESADITETVSCPVDVIFGISDEAPGSGYSLSVIQVNEVPNSTTGLLSNYPTTYWEIWSEDNDFDGDYTANYDFDGDFTATINFHFDNITGIADEANLNLYRRDDANDTWTSISSTLTNEGSDLDGTGYLSITINESTSGGFSGQYILTSDDVDNPLPVNLISYTAIGGKNHIILRWATAAEIENLGYIILRSNQEDGDYQEIDSYINNNSLVGTGNTSVGSNYEYLDSKVDNGQKYWYKLVDISYSGNRRYHGPIFAVPLYSEIKIVDSNSPQTFSLYQNYPNPFNPSTKIGFDIPEVEKESSELLIIIYDLLGRKVKTLYIGQISPGCYEIEWDGLSDGNQPLPSGIYIYQLSSKQQIFQSRKMTLLR